MWYGYVGPKLGGVTQDYRFINNIIKRTPYATFRAFSTDTAAWNFVKSRRHNYVLNGLNSYGNIFDNLKMVIRYFIGNKGVYANLDTSRLGRIRLVNLSSDIVVEYRNDLILLFIPIDGLHKLSLDSHAIALLLILKCVGDIVDIEILLTTFSVFFMLTQYKGTRNSYVQVINHIETRQGNVAYTIRK